MLRDRHLILVPYLLGSSRYAIPRMIVTTISVCGSIAISPDASPKLDVYSSCR
jgi:hypothetical protein